MSNPYSYLFSRHACTGGQPADEQAGHVRAEGRQLWLAAAPECGAGGPSCKNFEQPYSMGAMEITKFCRMPSLG